MATLVSPGVSISVIDQSINVGAGQGTVPLIFIATQQDKSDPTGTGIALGTTQANAGKVWSITSQRDLVTTFGDPTFYSVSGTSLNGYPLNEYGLLAAYSYLGISNLARVVRADINTTQLEATPIEPTSPAVVGTYWLDEAVSTYGLFVKSGTFPNEVWVSVTPRYVLNFPQGSGINNTPNEVTPSLISNSGDVAMVWQTDSSILSYFVQSGEGGWTELGAVTQCQVIIQSVWPDLSTAPISENYWIKTTSPAQGANLVLRRMNATTGSFVQVESPILNSDNDANVYYDTNPLNSLGQVYIEPWNDYLDLNNNDMPNSLMFRVSLVAPLPGNNALWTPLTGIVGSVAVPTSPAVNGQMWYNALLGLDSDGYSTVDILVNDGQDHWINCELQGFTLTGDLPYMVYPQSGDPRDNIGSPAMNNGDIWVDTDMLPYPVIKRWDDNNTIWVLVDNTDQSTPSGIIFQDARPNPLFGTNTGENNSGGTNPDLDPDAPQAALYPKGFLLWNTRYSTNNVKTWHNPYVYDGVTAAASTMLVPWPDINNGRWVTTSGNNPGGVPYMGAAAQQIMIVKAIQSTIISNEEIRAEDLYFNLIAAPGFVEAIDEMLVLNEDRKDTAFVVGDSPFTLNATGTSLQNWATNASVAYSNGSVGLVSASKYVGVYYPSGLSTNVDGTDVVVPPSHMALRTIAYNDQVAYPWFAPAGLQRGVVNNAASVGWVNSAGQYIPTKLNEGQRDILYINGINPIRTLPAGGIVVFGQKTRQAYSSATDRINVVRLETYLRYQLNLLAMPFLFEPNDTTTRKAVKDAFDRFLSELITLRALYDFLVVCDLSNNTPARIDRNELWIDIAIQPVKAVEFIYIPIRIKNTGSSLSAA